MPKCHEDSRLYYEYLPGNYDLARFVILIQETRRSASVFEGWGEGGRVDAEGRYLQGILHRRR